MSVEIVMPKLSDTMEEGTILKWLKNVGDEVTSGEPIAEVETDKADMELEAAESGILREIKVPAGGSAPVGAVLALVDEEGGGASASRRDDAPSARQAAPGDAGSARARERDESNAGTRHTDQDDADETGTRSNAAAERPAAGAAPNGEDRSDVKVSPAARKIAAERGIDLRTVHGSGPDGRVVKQDVQSDQSADARHDDVRLQAHGRVHGETGGAPVSERQELSRMRQSIARRMTEAFRDIPHFYVTAAIDMSEAVRLKQSLEASGLTSTPVTYTHMILKATALALKRHPRLNASFHDDAIEIKGEINIGLAVAVDDGLIVPILRHVDELSLEEIALEARRLAEQAKRGRFASEDLSGGTFTVSNMGMLDIEEFAAVINPPQAAILAVGAIKERPIVRAGAVVAARTMRVTLSCDHRIIDGVVGGRFLEELKRLLENPLILVMRERAAR